MKKKTKLQKLIQLGKTYNAKRPFLLALSRLLSSESLRKYSTK